MRLTTPVHPAWASISSSALRLAEDLGQRAARLGLSNACGDASEGGEHPLRVCYRMGYASASNSMRREIERELFRLQRRAEMHSGIGHAEIHGVNGRRGAPRRASHRRGLVVLALFNDAIVTSMEATPAPRFTSNATMGKL